MEHRDMYFDYGLLEPAEAELSRLADLMRLQDWWRLKARCRWLQLVKRLLAQQLRAAEVPPRELAGS